eukprot:1172907-Pleurochrysis_carterae.AAC.2
MSAESASARERVGKEGGHESERGGYRQLYVVQSAKRTACRSATRQRAVPNGPAALTAALGCQGNMPW